MKIIYDDTETLNKIHNEMPDGDNAYYHYVSITHKNTSQERDLVWSLRRILTGEQRALVGALGDYVDQRGW